MEKTQAKGITLIALVVTIVVLLILAGTTINMLFGSDGIFNIANSAKEQYEIGALKDRINNVIADWSIERLTKPGVTVDDLWDKMVEVDIIDNPEEDVAGPEKEGENDVYQVTTNEGYIVEIIVMPDGSVVIGDVIKGDKLPPKIGEITSTSESNSIHIEVEIERAEGEVSLSYYYKKEEEESNYKALKEEVTDLTADLTGLEQNVVYNIKVVIKDNNGTSEKKINVTTGELTGVVTQKGETIWNNGTASIELETTKKGVTIQYQINTMEGEWQDYEGPITGLRHEDVVFAVVTDGTNQSGYSSINILDEKEPQQASINLSETSTNTTGSITATVTHTDNESGVEPTSCKWIYNTNPNPIGIEESSYLNAFNSNGQTITLSSTTQGTYYLHVLTQDKAGNKTETISQAITVTQLVTGITLNQTNVTLTEGETLQLTATITPGNANNKNVSWSSNNNTVASVSNNGLVTAKTAGTATITVTANDGSGIIATCSITVNPALPTIQQVLKAGAWVRYEDGTGTPRNCVVLYDSSSSYGVEIITMETVEDVTLGYNDPTVSGSNNFAKAMNSYNNAISTLNNATSKYINTTYVDKARSVGSVPNNPNSQSGYNTMQLGESYSGKSIDNDNSYATDMNQMEELNINDIDNIYWLASHYVYSSSSGNSYYVCNVDTYGRLDDYRLCTEGSTGYQNSYSVVSGLRPVFHLKSNVKVTGGNGTSSSPYTLGT